MNSRKESQGSPGVSTKKRLWAALWAGCGLTVVPDLFVTRLGHFSFDSFPSFYALVGFVSCAALILFSKLVGFFLKVREDYYD